MITAPGIYTDIPPSVYFEDPTPEPSFSQSIGKIIIERSPLHAWYAHGRLNPDHRPDNDTKFDVGNIAHTLLIGRGKDIEVLEGFDDWRKKEAQERRAACAAAGKLAVLGKHYAKADRMVRAARDQLADCGLEHAFTEGEGNGEAVLAWKEDDCWLRQMVDWLDRTRCEVLDYKTTDMSVAPHTIGRMMVNAGWPIQAAMADRGLTILDPLGYRRKYRFVVQETEAPYALVVVEISPDVLTMGRKQLDYAIGIWKRCMRENVWPCYPTDVVTPELPGWFESAWLEREVHEAAAGRMEGWREMHDQTIDALRKAPPADLIMGG